MGIALPWEQAVRDHNAKPTSRCHCALCAIVLVVPASVKGALAAPYFLVAHARRPYPLLLPLPPPSSLGGGLLHFSVITAEKTGDVEHPWTADSRVSLELSIVD